MTGRYSKYDIIKEFRTVGWVNRMLIITLNFLHQSPLKESHLKIKKTDDLIGSIIQLRILSRIVNHLRTKKLKTKD